MRHRSDGPEDTGRNGYLQADEEWDGSGRPRIRILVPFWENASEELDYQFAVEETRGMLPSKRLEAIAAKLGKAGGGVKRMPRVRQTRRDRDGKLQELREQIARDRVVGDTDE